MTSRLSYEPEQSGLLRDIPNCERSSSLTQRNKRPRISSYKKTSLGRFGYSRGLWEIAGYSSPAEFITHALEKECAKFEGADSEEEIKKRLQGLGYIS